MQHFSMFFSRRLTKRNKKTYNVGMNQQTIISPVAYIRSDFKEKFGIPRQSGRAPSLTAEIVFLPEYACEEAIKSIEGFSHLWILFDFSKTREKGWSPTVRPPRLGGNERVGVFASRSPFRPNHIGLSCVRLIGVRKQAGTLSLLVSGADLLDGTPVFDIKPYLPFADCVPQATGGYATAHENEKLDVYFPEDLLLKIAPEKRQGLIECLADDPRPSYQDDCNRIYGMRFADYEIKFRVEKGQLTVVRLETVDNSKKGGVYYTYDT